MTAHQSTRRELLAGAGVLFAWPFLPKLALAEGRDPRLLVIVLRGALDGLAVAAPVGDPDWIKLRGDKALTLDGKPPAGARAAVHGAGVSTQMTFRHVIRRSGAGAGR